MSVSYTFIGLCPGGCHNGRPGHSLRVPSGYGSAVMHWTCEHCAKEIMSLVPPPPDIKREEMR